MPESNLFVIGNGLFQGKIEELFKNHFNSDNVKIVIESCTNDGDNFSGNLHRAIGINENDESNEDNSRKFSIILKITPSEQEDVDEEFQSREYYVYNEICKTFYDFQQSNGITPEKDGFYQYPKCYSSLNDVYEELLLLEDLKSNKFEMINNKIETVNIDHAKLVMSALAKMHSISFALKSKQPEKFHQLINQLSEKVFHDNEDHTLVGHFDGFKSTVFGVLNDDDGLYREKLNKFYDKNVFYKMMKFINGKIAEPHAVICHGDLWANNIMYQYDENHKPVDICFIDFQLTRYASPITDIVNFIFICTTKELRDEYFDELMKVYYGNLSDMVRRFECELNEIFSYEIFQEELKKYGGFGLPMAVTLLPVVTNQNDTGDYGEMTDEKNLLNNEKYRDRMHGVIEDVIRLGFI